MMRPRNLPARGTSDGPYLDGQFLIAMPTVDDRHFARSVVYLCLHSSDGAMGLIINQPAPKLSFPALLRQLDIIVDPPDDDHAPAQLDSMGVHVGGPVEASRGFVLHSPDYRSEGSTIQLPGGISLTSTIDVLRELAIGRGPKRAFMALGYAGWAPGQLEREIQANGWLNCKADPDLIFDRDADLKYDRALWKLGIDPSHLVGEAGHA